MCVWSEALETIAGKMMLGGTGYRRHHEDSGQRAAATNFTDYKKGLLQPQSQASKSFYRWKLLLCTSLAFLKACWVIWFFLYVWSWRVDFVQVKIERALVQVNRNTNLPGCEFPQRNNGEKNSLADADSATRELERRPSLGACAVPRDFNGKVFFCFFLLCLIFFFLLVWHVKITHVPKVSGYILYCSNQGKRIYL